MFYLRTALSIGINFNYLKYKITTQAVNRDDQKRTLSLQKSGKDDK